MRQGRLPRRAFSLIGMLVTLVLIMILSVVGLTALNKAVTGEGSAVEGTVHSFEDQLALYAMYQSLFTGAADHRGQFITPSLLTGSEDVTEDTTANLFSAMVMDRYIGTEQLISANEFSGYVEPIESYDFLAYDPANGVYWDSGFKADLDELSHVSYAHVPLYGERFERSWRDTMRAGFPIIGNRGPRDGAPDPSSWTYGRSGEWGGHLCYADGSIDFVTTFTPPAVFYETGGVRYADNIFKVEDGPAGNDAILSFTRSMKASGPELQFD